MRCYLELLYEAEGRRCPGDEPWFRKEEAWNIRSGDHIFGIW